MPAWYRIDEWVMMLTMIAVSGIGIVFTTRPITIGNVLFSGACLIISALLLPMAVVVMVAYSVGDAIRGSY